MKKTLAVANTIALLVTIFVNYLSNTGLLNGNTMKTMSDQYFNYFTPAGYAFSIWGLIYLTLLGFVIFTLRSSFGKQDKDDHVLKVGWWFVISCVANSLWVVAWLYDYTALSVMLMIVILVSLLKITLNAKLNLVPQTLTSYFFNYLPFALYSGWISVALIANIAAYLTKLNWDAFGISAIYWTVIMICIAGLVNLFMIFTRNLREYGLVGIWALVAISVSNGNDAVGKPIVYACYAVAAILSVSIALNLLKARKH